MPTPPYARPGPGPRPAASSSRSGRFTNTAPLSVINLASLPAIPSIFDEARRHLRPPLRFFYEFSNRISAPVRTAARSEAEIVFVGREHCVDEDRGDGRPVLALESAAVRDQLPASALAL